LLLGWISAGVAAALAVVVIVPYLVIVIGDRGPGRPRGAQGSGPSAGDRSPRPDHPVRGLLALIVVDVGLIIAGSAGMVQAGLALGDNLHVSRAILGVLVLAPLTSIPNAVTGVRLGLAGRGSALVGETFNSNTINLEAGVIIPSLFVTLAAATALGKLQLAWLLAATMFTLIALGRRGGMRRAGAMTLIALYGAFVAGTLVGS
jgi:Ca2+/Na+ antiporter